MRGPRWGIPPRWASPMGSPVGLPRNGIHQIYHLPYPTIFQALSKKSYESKKKLSAYEIIHGYKAYLAKSKNGLAEKKLTAKEIIDGYEAHLAKSEKKLTANEINEPTKS